MELDLLGSDVDAEGERLGGPAYVPPEKSSDSSPAIIDGELLTPGTPVIVLIPGTASPRIAGEILVTSLPDAKAPKTSLG